MNKCIDGIEYWYYLSNRVGTERWRPARGTFERHVTKPGSKAVNSLGGGVPGREQPVQRLQLETAGLLHLVLCENSKKVRRASDFQKQTAYPCTMLWLPGHCCRVASQGFAPLAWRAGYAVSTKGRNLVRVRILLFFCIDSSNCNCKWCHKPGITGDGF